MADNKSLAFNNYWARKSQLQNQVPHFPVRMWHATDGLCDIESIYFKSLENKKSLLDVGAGDLRIKNKLQKAGFLGEYHTQDISAEHTHTYSSLADVKRKYEAIICLDVIEHMPLNDGLQLIQRMIDLLEDGGVLILQTPNARCIRSPMAGDMTHVHAYNLPDLWVLLTTNGFSCDGYRVVFKSPGGWRSRFYSLLSKFVITRLIGADYADNIALVARNSN